MTLKDATANSLLMFVAATCVVLIVRALPQSPPAAQAPFGGETGKGGPGGAATPAMQEGIKVFYLHGNTRCPTCRSIESYAKEAVESGFADELRRGSIAWGTINYESPGNEHYAKDYEAAAPVVVLARFKDGKQTAWKSLPEVWEYVGDKKKFVEFVQTSLREFLGQSGGASPAVSNAVPNPVRAPAESPPVPLPIPE